MVRRVLVTGANGFIGREVVRNASYNYIVTALVRTGKNYSPNLNIHEVVGLEDFSGLKMALAGQNVVIHTAGIAHFSENEDFLELRRVNVEGMLNVAKSCIEAGVQRFLFVSSVNVTTSENNMDQQLDVTCQIKKEAEEQLLMLGKRSGMEVVIIRSPLVYGPCAPGNFGLLQKLLLSGLPLPLGAVYNKRSLVALDNLVSLIITCIDHSAAANQTFLVSDDDDVSTTELLRRMANTFGKKRWLMPVPKWAMLLPARILGKQAALERLFGSLQVDITHTKETLGWHPPVTMAQQLRKIAESLSNK